MKRLLPVGLALLYPLVAGHSLSSACQILIYLMLASGLNLIVGMCGLLHLGYAAFFAIGAFVMAYLTSPQSPFAHAIHLGFWPALVCSCLFTGVAGAAVALPTLRLRGDYLAIVTMGFGLMIHPIMSNFDEQTKAITGMSAVAAPTFGTAVLTSGNALGWYYFLLVFVGLTWWFCERVRYSSLGRCLRALREDEVASSACGVDNARSKLQALTLGSAIAGLAGGLYASNLYTLNLAFPLDFNGSIMILGMVILGGTGSPGGVLLGGVVLGALNLIVTPACIDLFNRNVLPSLSASLQGSPWLLKHLEPLFDLSKAQFLIFGLTLVLVMLLRPQGILPEQPIRHE
jgi:branched-chain amino acid transport system permease protein